jgi:predicted  nucleic acid-binding Zn-ribbon protein
MSFSCMECGHQFKSVKAAQRAAFSDRGCPKCGGSDIDLSPVRKPVAFIDEFMSVRPEVLEAVIKVIETKQA